MCLYVCAFACVCVFLKLPLSGCVLRNVSKNRGDSPVRERREEGDERGEGRNRGMERRGRRDIVVRLSTQILTLFLILISIICSQQVFTHLWKPVSGDVMWGYATYPVKHLLYCLYWILRLETNNLFPLWINLTFIFYLMVKKDDQNHQILSLQWYMIRKSSNVSLLRGWNLHLFGIFFSETMNWLIEIDVWGLNLQKTFPQISRYRNGTDFSYPATIGC